MRELISKSLKSEGRNGLQGSEGTGTELLHFQSRLDQEPHTHTGRSERTKADSYQASCALEIDPRCCKLKRAAGLISVKPTWEMLRRVMSLLFLSSH